MLAVLAQIDGYDPMADAAVTLRACSVDDVSVCHLGAATWWPSLSKLPVLRYDLFDGAFEGQITAPSSSLSMQTEPWPDFGRYALADARVRIWTGEVGADVLSYTLRFDGRTTAQPSVKDGVASVDFAADDKWLDAALLSTYAGTTGAEGTADLKGQVKPLALGAPRYVAGKLIDAVNSVFQISSYGAMQGVDVAMEKLARFGTATADYAGYSALVAASVPAGRWATARAVGMARLGAPPVGQISFLVSGDAAGPDGWARKPGQIVRRLALLSGGVDKIDDASLDAIDVARPYDISLYLDEQATARDKVQGIAASVNAVAGVSWLGKLFIAPVEIGSPALTLAADGSSLPPVASVEQIDIAAPYAKLAITAERAWTVHALADVAFTATLIDMGAYAAGTTYREGNIVQDQDSSWVYINPVPSSGNAPPALPTTSNAYWKALAKAGTDGAAGASAFTLVDVANSILTPNSVRTVATGGGWVTKARTAESYKAVQVSARLTVNTGFGLTTDPSVDNSYASVDYWFHRSSGGVVRYYRNGVVRGTMTDPHAGDPNTAYPASVWSDGTTVRYFYDGTEIAAWAHAVNAAGEDVYGVFTLAAYPSAYIDQITVAPSGQAGANGLNTAIVFAYQRATSAPAGPSASTTYTFSTKALTGLNNGWSTTILAGSNPLYAIAATASSATDTDTIASGEWSSPVVLAQNGSNGTNGTDGTDGSNGLNAATVYIYQRATSAPALPSATTTYTFATGGLTGLNNGWSRTIPAGTDPIYVSQATAAGTGATDTIATGEWAAVQVLAQNGANGSNGTDGYSQAQVVLYQRATSAPAVPASTLTYTFATGALSGTLGSWSRTPPAANGNPLYITVASAVSNGATDTIGTGEWSAPVISTQDGGTGSNGLNVATMFLFKRAVSAPAVPASTLTYTFASGVLSGTLSGWSQSAPAHDGNPLYFTTATAASVGSTDTIATGEWATPQIQAQDGAPGVSAKSFDLSTQSITITANYDGSSKSGQFPKLITVKVVDGSTDVTASAIVTLTESYSGAIDSSYSGGTVTISRVDSVGWVGVQVTYAGVDLGTKRIDLPRNTDPQPPSSQTSQAAQLGVGVANTTYTDFTGTLTLKANASGGFSIAGYGDYQVSGGNLIQIAGKGQYRLAGSSTWIDAGAEVVGTSSSGASGEEPNVGRISINQPVTGLTPGAFYEGRIALRKSLGATGASAYVDGQWSITQ